MHCRYCGTENFNSASVCISCAKPLFDTKASPSDTASKKVEPHGMPPFMQASPQQPTADNWRPNIEHYEEDAVSPRFARKAYRFMVVGVGMMAALAAGLIGAWWLNPS